MARFQTAPRSLAGIEPAACVAAHEPDGGLILYTNRGQSEAQQAVLAQALDMDQPNLRIRSLGSAPAGPWETAMHYAALSLSLKSGRAVKIATSLDDNVALWLACARYGDPGPGRSGRQRPPHGPGSGHKRGTEGGANQAKLDQVMACAMAYATDNFRCRVSQVFTSTPPAEISATRIAAAVHFSVEGAAQRISPPTGHGPDRSAPGQRHPRKPPGPVPGSRQEVGPLGRRPSRPARPVSPLALKAIPACNWFGRKQTRKQA